MSLLQFTVDHPITSIIIGSFILAFAEIVFGRKSRREG